MEIARKESKCKGTNKIMSSYKIKLTSSEKAYISPITIAEVIRLLRISNIILLIQYARTLIPLITYICLRFFSLSLSMKLTTDAGINENPIAITNTMNTPFTVAAVYLND